MTTFFHSMACRVGEFLRRMLDPRAIYIPGEPRVGRGWWALFIAGILTLGILGVVAMIAVWSDKKFLKQMGELSDRYTAHLLTSRRTDAKCAVPNT
ncbi:MAG: hypothetical protein J4G04_05150, partial [Nitrosopumilaceae archaeon]|nr:hypothetical protein [Nitrosopumilaceae archaeon]